MIRLALLLLPLTVPAQAFVLDGAILRQSGDGAFVKLSTDPAFAVGADTFDDPDLHAFDEERNITLSEPIRVDTGGTDGMIPQGIVVASHYVFFDSLDGTLGGHVDFDAPILGIAASERTLATTDFLPGPG